MKPFIIGYLDAEGEAIAADHLMGGMQRRAMLVINHLIQLQERCANLHVQELGLLGRRIAQADFMDAAGRLNPRWLSCRYSEAVMSSCMR